MEKKESNHKKWAGDKKPSMKRRSEEKDYLDRGIYLITIATEGRLLMLAPYPFHNEKLTDMRARCLALNDLAARICQDSAKPMY